VTEPNDLDYASHIAREVVALLQAHGMKTAIGGAIAYGIWGAARGTKDADVNVFIGEARYAELQGLIESGGLGPVPGRASWTEEERRTFVGRCHEGAVAIAYKGDFRVDFFVPSIPFYDEAERTLRWIRHPSGQLVPVLSAEALSVFKLLYFRPKDLVDLAGLVARQGTALDSGYVSDQLKLMFPEGDDRITEWERIVRVHGPAGKP